MRIEEIPDRKHIEPYERITYCSCCGAKMIYGYEVFSDLEDKEFCLDCMSEILGVSCNVVIDAMFDQWKCCGTKLTDPDYYQIRRSILEEIRRM